MPTKPTRQTIIAVVDDAMTDLLYYDRKESESVPMYGIEDAILDGTVTVAELVELFRKSIASSVNERKKARK